MCNLNKKHDAKCRSLGFTLVELLLVVSIISILSGIVISIVNSDRQKKIAQDAIKKATLDKLITGVQSYYVIEGKYPLDESGDGNPLNDSGAGIDDSLVGVYISVWPDNDTDSYEYKTNGSIFQVYIVESINSANYFKYSSDWDTIKECGATNIDTIGTCSAVSP